MNKIIKHVRGRLSEVRPAASSRTSRRVEELSEPHTQHQAEEQRLGPPMADTMIQAAELSISEELCSLGVLLGEARYHSESLPQISLCERCSKLEIGTHGEKVGRAQYGRIAGITLFSLDTHCQLCEQFGEIFRIAASEARSVTVPEFDLSRHALELLDDRGIFQGQYLSIHFRRSPRQIHLFPTQGWFTRHNPHPGGLNTQRYPLGNLIEPYRPNLGVIKSLLQTCHERHPSTCKPRPPPINILRVIDCRTRKIVAAQEGQKYICLSYVWGKSTGIVDEPVHNSRLPDNLPSTIHGAMEVAISLRIPFLWIDRYCTLYEYTSRV